MLTSQFIIKDFSIAHFYFSKDLVIFNDEMTIQNLDKSWLKLIIQFKQTFLEFHEQK